MKILYKTTSYGITHVIVATMVAYSLTGNMAIALGIGLIEPIVQTFVFSFHEMLWEKKTIFNKRFRNISFNKKLVNNTP